MNRFARPFVVDMSAMRSPVGDQVGSDSMLPPKPKLVAVSLAALASAALPT